MWSFLQDEHAACSPSPEYCLAGRFLKLLGDPFNPPCVHWHVFFQVPGRSGSSSAGDFWVNGGFFSLKARLTNLFVSCGYEFWWRPQWAVTNQDFMECHKGFFHVAPVFCFLDFSNVFFFPLPPTWMIRSVLDSQEIVHPINGQVYSDSASTAPGTSLAAGLQKFSAKNFSMVSSHRIHGTNGIFPYIYHKNSTIHVGKHSIHGWYGVCGIPAI